jgi:hypothetical protein
VDATRRMGLGTTPHPIPDLSSNDERVVRNIGSIFNVGYLDLVNVGIAIIFVLIYQDVVWLDIRTHDAFLM